MSKEDVIIAELDFIKQSQARIECLMADHIRDHCRTCTNAPTFTERLRSHWWHIVRLWGAVLFVGTSAGGGLLWLGIRYFDHVAGK